MQAGDQYELLINSQQFSHILHQRRTQREFRYDIKDGNKKPIAVARTQGIANQRVTAPMDKGWQDVERLRQMARGKNEMQFTSEEAVMERNRNRNTMGNIRPAPQENIDYAEVGINHGFDKFDLPSQNYSAPSKQNTIPTRNVGNIPERVSEFSRNQGFGEKFEMKGEMKGFGNFDDFNFENFSKPEEKKESFNKFDDFKIQSSNPKPQPQPQHQNIDLLDLMDAPIIPQNQNPIVDPVDLQFQRNLLENEDEDSFDEVDGNEIFSQNFNQDNNSFTNQAQFQPNPINFNDFNEFSNPPPKNTQPQNNFGNNVNQFQNQNQYQNQNPNPYQNQNQFQYQNQNQNQNQFQFQNQNTNKNANPPQYQNQQYFNSPQGFVPPAGNNYPSIGMTEYPSYSNPGAKQDINNMFGNLVQSQYPQKNNSHSNEFDMNFNQMPNIPIQNQNPIQRPAPPVYSQQQLVNQYSSGDLI